MMKIKHLVIALAVLLGGVAVVPATTASAVSPVSNFAACGTSFLGFPNWYKNLPGAGDCKPRLTSLNQVWVVVLNLVDIMIRVAGLVVLGLILWGSYKYIRSTGDSKTTTEAKETILNAVIGLIIVIAAVAIVEFAAGSIH